MRLNYSVSADPTHTATRDGATLTDCCHSYSYHSVGFGKSVEMQRSRRTFALLGAPTYFRSVDLCDDHHCDDSSRALPRAVVVF